MNLLAEVKERIAQLLIMYPTGLLIPHLMFLVSDLIPVHGDKTIASAQNPNLLLWSDVSEVFFRVFCEMLAENTIFIHPVKETAYYKRKINPGLPLAIDQPDRIYETPHWFPVAIRNTPCLLDIFENKRVWRAVP